LGKTIKILLTVTLRIEGEGSTVKGSLLCFVVDCVLGHHHKYLFLRYVFDVYIILKLICCSIIKLANMLFYGRNGFLVICIQIDVPASSTNYPSYLKII
jgi:hypothetical protein